MVTKKQSATKKSPEFKKAPGRQVAAKKAKTAVVNKPRPKRSLTAMAEDRNAAESGDSTTRGATSLLPADTKRLAHGLRALLHTMQTVQRFEEPLCSMMHAMERKRPNAALLRELRTTLESLPVNDYRDDVENLLHVLG